MSGELTLVGRSSSHFTRVARLFASVVGVSVRLEVVKDLSEREATVFGDNPALKVPILVTPEGRWFGSLNICRQLHRLAPSPPAVIWPEQLKETLTANAFELVAQGMSTEVSWIMSGLGLSGEAAQRSAYRQKLSASMRASLTWLEQRIDEITATLPASAKLNLLELMLYCWYRHLEFRDVLPLAETPRLAAFCESFEARYPTADTEYRFDA